MYDFNECIRIKNVKNDQEKKLYKELFGLTDTSHEVIDNIPQYFQGNQQEDEDNDVISMYKMKNS